MDQRHRDRNDKHRDPTAGGEGTGQAPGGAEEREDRARRLLEAGDDAIRRALSRDSAQFLSHNRQQGGQ